MTSAALLDAAARPAPRSTGGRNRRRWTARALLALIVAAPIAIYLWVAAHRLGYPYELDWMEGGSVELVARVVDGHSLYAPPSLAYVGWTYPPLYYWLSGAVAEITGIGFVPLRLVSTVASVVGMATLAGTVWRETRDRLAGLVAAGLYAATFQISGAWFDTGRVDSMLVALTLLALACGRWARTVRGGIGVGALAFLAFFTKQTGLVAVIPALVYLVLVRRRVGVSALLTLLGLVAASTLVLDDASDGWYRYYVFSELSGQPWAQQVWVSFWTTDIWHQEWPIVVLVASAAVLHGARRARPGRPPTSAYWAAASLGLIASAWLSRLHTGGYANVLMPAYAATALLGGLAFGTLTPQTVPQGRPRSRLRFAAPLAGVAAVFQVALLAYSPQAQLPTTTDRAAGAQLIARLRSLPGPIIVLRHPWYATLAGKGSSAAQQEAIHDVLRSSAQRGPQALRTSLAEALDADRIQTVVLDYAGDGSVLGPDFAREFHLQSAPITPSRLYPLTDLRTAPLLLYRRITGLTPPGGQAPRSPDRAAPERLTAS